MQQWSGSLVFGERINDGQSANLIVPTTYPQQIFYGPTPFVGCCMWAEDVALASAGQPDEEFLRKLHG